MKKIILVLALFPSIAFGQAFRVGSGIQITPKASAPTATSGRGILWVDSADSNKLHYTTPSGSDAAVGSGGGGGGGTVSVDSPLGGDGSSGDHLTCTLCVTTTGSQTLTNKTLTAPIINGLTSSGSTSIDFSGNTGTFKTPTGAATLNGSTTLADGKDLTITSGNLLGTYVLAGTPTIGASITTTDGTYSLGDSSHRLTNVAAKSIIGGTLATIKVDDAVGTELHYGANAGIYVGSLGANEIDFAANGATGYWKLLASSMTPDTDKTFSFGSLAKRVSTGFFLSVGGGGTSGEQPSCDSSLRGQLYAVAAAGGASDTLQICDKSAADAYAWRTVFTAP